MSKVVVITGASGGIGASLARRLGSEGHRLVLAARRLAELESVARAAGGEAVSVMADVTKRADVERVRDEALRAFGHVDVWVNNAGRGIGRRVLDLTDADFDEMMLVNVKSALYGMQVIAPHFIHRGSGQVVNVSSMLGRVPLATYRSAYSAAKSALNTLTANLRMDLRASHPGIMVTLVIPGPVSTDFAQNALGGTPSTPGGGARHVQTADEVAAVVAEAIAHPVPEVFTSPALQETSARYMADVAAFEAGMAQFGAGGGR